MRRSAAVLLAFLIATVSARAQLVESIEVRVTNIEVVVTDRAGKPVHGLTREDFELFEGGKPQTITNFYEVRGSEMAVDADPSADAPVVSEETRQRRIIVFIDNTSLDPIRRNVALRAVGTALDSLLRPGDDAMVVAWERRLKIMQPFTTDAAAVRQIIQTSASRSGGATLTASERQRVIHTSQDLLNTARQSRGRGRSIADAYRESISIARAFAESQYSSTRGLLGGLRQMIATLNGLEGRKVLIMLGGELEQRPGLDVLEEVNAMFVPFGVGVPGMLTKDMDRNVVTELDRVVRSAAGSGVALYMIDGGDRSGGRSVESLGTETAASEFMANTATWLTMGQLAHATGGRAISGTSNYRVLLDGLESDLGSYYSLGYRATTGEGIRSVRVRVRTPGLTARSRRVILHKSAHEQMQDRVVSNVFHRRAQGDFPVTVRTAPPKQEGRHFKIDMTVEFPSSLTYLPDGTSLAGEFGVYFVVANPDGALSPVASEVKPVKFAAKDAEVIGRRPFHYTTTLLVRSGEQTVSVVVVDRVDGRTGFGTAQITPR